MWQGVNGEGTTHLFAPSLSLSTQNVDCHDDWQSGNQAIRQSGNQAIRQSGNQAIRQSGNQAIRQSNHHRMVYTQMDCCYIQPLAETSNINKSDRNQVSPIILKAKN
ncbi:MAG: hypothetical protein ACRC8B_21510 [Aeromonas sobria]